MTKCATASPITAPSGAKVHLPLLAVMVVFTVGGLLLMFGG